jgi:ribonucleoside-triphosphate reductase
MYKNETMRGGKGDLNNPIFETMKHQTLAVGFIGIAEMCVALFGESHFKNTEANKFAFDIVKRIRTFCDESTK